MVMLTGKKRAKEKQDLFVVLENMSAILTQLKGAHF
jgi:hypothetical protein